MVRRKKDFGENVTLSDETVAKLLGSKSKHQHEPKLFLDPWDIIAMERAEREAKDIAHSLERCEHRHEQMMARIAELQGAKEQLKAAMTAAQERGRKLADTLAARYDIDWRTHVFNPDTGEISRND